MKPIKLQEGSDIGKWAPVCLAVLTVPYSWLWSVKYIKFDDNMDSFSPGLG